MFMSYRKDTAKRNALLTFAYCSFSFFFFMYIWSNVFYAFRGITLGKLTWILVCISVYIYSQKLAYSMETADSREIHKNFNILILSEVANEISRNLSGYLHVPGPLLKDVGFLAFAELNNKLLERFGDILTLIPFVILFIIAFTMDSKRIGKFIADLLRIFSMFYIVRSCCIWVTLLPGPAPHCRPGGSFRPPQDWIDVIGHMPVDGISFTTCGDLVPSGHIGFVTIALVAILRELPRRFLSYRKNFVLGCFLYELITGYFIIATRKHYTVDVVVGFFLSFFITIIFKDGWKPALFGNEDSYIPLPVDSQV
ncbi:uncharacterized protein [Blastocystis hominis]|uniref:Sphingomyelin synthase-like domain-containing protein n=1 Tax=Blastocystis hominis TaxID=12968 RepID=D8LYV2_BLAHO|nr:uncharacterized protein [Blastocystis hominis]CBK20991.2 unnamed protein product [Blastocystis hominis]|eukprot:XP_012895039.1 uncharacterized protein [Blastocystis hominis]